MDNPAYKSLQIEYDLLKIRQRNISDQVQQLKRDQRYLASQVRELRSVLQDAGLIEKPKVVHEDLRMHTRGT